MAEKSIKKNYIYNVSYQILTLITPFITAPYLSRVLGVDGVGTVSYSESVVSYFCLFATLGITLYGQREISYVQDDRIKRSHVFWETKIQQMITSAVVLAVYVPFCLFQQRYIIYMILSLNLFAVITDVSWFFQGLEEFGKIVFRNLIQKVLMIICIFVFIRSSSDLNIYILISALFPVIGNITLWFYLPSYVAGPRLKTIHPVRNIRTIMSLFIPTIAIQIYTVLDKTMIGLITQSDAENGYYEQAIKISRMLLAVVTALGTVMNPRVGHYFGKKDTEKINELMYRAYRFVWSISIPLCFGLVSVSAHFVPWFFGPGYDKVIPLMSILSFLLLAIGINNITGVQYLIPTGRQNTFTKTVIMGAAVNLVLNIILITRFQSIGAAVSSVTSETLIALVQFFIIRRELKIGKIFASCIPYLISGTVMLVILKAVGMYLEATILNTVILVISGAFIYIGMLLIMRDSFFIGNIKSLPKLLTKKEAHKNE